MKTKSFFLILGFVLLAGAVGQAQTITDPGWFQAQIDIDHFAVELDAGSKLEEGTPPSEDGESSYVTGPAIAEYITPEIQALANGLENDPKKIFDWVHDHVRYVHYFGSKKGAQLTLLERSGNDFDQAALLVALYRAAGLTAIYQFGTAYIRYENNSTHRDFRHLVGTTFANTNWTSTLSYFYDFNNMRGFPFIGWFNGDTNNVMIHRVWVRLSLTNPTRTYFLDPAYKISEPITGINLSTAMSLDTNQLMTAAGGTATADYVQSLDEASLRSNLTANTTSLLNYIQSTMPNAAVEDVLGGTYVGSSEFASLSQSLPFTPNPINASNPIQNWDYIPTNFMSKLNVAVDGTNFPLRVPQLLGGRLSLTFSTNGLAQLWLEDEKLLEKQTGSSNTVNVVLAVDHPHGTWDTTNNVLINGSRNDLSVTNTYQRTNASYAIVYAFEPDSAWVQSRQQVLDNYRAQGLPDSSREVVTESLNVSGLNWLLQTERMARVLAAQQSVILQNHHRFGRMAQEAGKGYYIDIYAQLDGGYPANGESDGDLARFQKIFDLQNYFGSAAEHGLIEQMQSSNLVAASTVKMLQIGNTNSQKTFLATSNNWTNGANVRSQLTGYNLTALDASISAGLTILLPQNGSNTVAGAGTWAGYGAVQRGKVNGLYTMAMLISGAYNGGYVSVSTAVIYPPFLAAQFGYVQPLYFNPVSPFVGTPTGADPVSMADGSFRLSSDDLSIGQAPPRGMTFSRYYSPTRRNHNLAGMANGWIHNFYINASDTSASLAGLGDTTPAQMASMIVATRAAFEIYGGTNATPKNWAVTSLIAKWGLDQIINKGVSISLGDDTIQFVKQPDGTITPPAKCTMTLLKTNGVYWLQERHGNTFKFSTAGLLTNITDQYSQSMTVTYNGSNWISTVKDWKDRQFTFNYTGSPSRLTSVTDGARTVSFGYDTNYNSQGDLVSFTDPESKTNRFTYDSNHQLIVARDGLGRVVVSNVYDNVGRMTTQYSAGNTNQAWRFFWSGFVNVQKDPQGGRTEYRYDDRHRLVETIDPLTHYTALYYDGQDHLIETVSHLLNYNDYVYDGQHNLTMTMDPLGYTNGFIYDGQNNLVASVDARGNTNRYGYNSRFQVTAQTNAAGDVVSFTYNTNTDGTLASRIDSAGTTTFGYDSYGQLSSIVYPNSLGTNQIINTVFGDVATNINPRGFATTFQYNYRRQLTTTTAPTNLITQLAFDDAGNVSSTTDGLGFATTNTWSATKQLLTTLFPSTPQGVPVITNVYDSRDWLHHTVDPLQQATFYTYDAAQRLIGVTDPLQRLTKYGYDGDNRKILITNAANEVTRQFWTNQSFLIKITDPATNSVLNAFDGAANQTRLTNRNGKIWQFHYDAANRLTNSVSPLSKTNTQVFNNRGLLQSIIEPSGQSNLLVYDALGRVATNIDSVGTGTFIYDFNGNLKTNSENGQSLLRTYDVYDRLASYTDAGGNDIQYRYDNNGNLKILIYPGGRTVTYSYDSLNRLTNVTDWANRQASFTYDLSSRLTSITRPNGTVRSNVYDEAGQLKSIIEQAASHAPIAFFSFNYDLTGRVQWEFAGPVPHSYTAPTRTETYDDDNRLATVNGQSVTNDLDGNMTGGPLPSGEFAFYSYDARNRLITAGGLGYAYDPAGNRTAITNGTNVTSFVVNPNTRLPQVLMRTRNGVTNYYVYGAGLLYEVTETTATTNTATYHFDARGSTVALTDANGNVTDHIEYSAYGAPSFRMGTNDTPFLYNGRYGVQSDGNGLLYMRARYYNHYLCRFVNSDPAGFSGGLNHFAYANGNPISFLDPFGLSAHAEGSGRSWLQEFFDPTSEEYQKDQFREIARVAAAIRYRQSLPANEQAVNSLPIPLLANAVHSYNALKSGDPNAMYEAGARFREEGYATILTAGLLKFLAPTPGGGTTPVYRAVMNEELADINASGVLRNPAGIENKYFSTTAEGAASYAKQAYGKFGDTSPYTIIKVDAPNSLIPQIIRVDGGIPAITIPSEALPRLGTPQVMPYAPIPH